MAARLALLFCTRNIDTAEMPGKCSFQNGWLVKPEFKEWLMKVKGDERSAVCSLCMKTFSIANSGLSQVLSHSTGAKHKSLINLKAEKGDEIFKRMFPDSGVAKMFHCGEKKTSYLTTFGLAPHFKDLLMTRVKSQDEFVLLFDESLNKKNQKKQMDLHIRFWDSDTVITRFYNAEFMGHATAEDMMAVFESSTEGLNRRGILQLSMDGPKVNWKFYNMIEREIKAESNTSLLNVGSYGLHVVHGAYKKGIDSTGWSLSSLLSAFYRLFKDSPARRDDYCNVLDGDCPLMPLKHCPTRWVENVIVLERSLELLPNMKIFVKAVEKKTIPNPQTKTFDTVKEACADLLLPVKLHFAISVAKQVEPFLTK